MELCHCPISDQGITIENTNVCNLVRAVYSARNALNSWDKSDSDLSNEINGLGEKDLDLACRLIKAGSDHSKFLRMIYVTVDITAPIFWIAEHDTYKVATVRNSCSFMHKGLSKKFEKSDFYYPYEDNFINEIITKLNLLRDEYLKTTDRDKQNKLFLMIRSLLPQGYRLKYTWSGNYQTLINIWRARKEHRLPQWSNVFVKWIEILPYMRKFLASFSENNTI